MDRDPRLRSDVEIEGLQGQVDVFSEFEPNLLGARHKISYRNRLRQRVNFKFDSQIDSDGQIYVDTTVKSDTIALDGKLWIHVGRSNTGSRKFTGGAAEIHTKGGQLQGSVKVSYQCYGDAPYSRPYTGTLSLPLT